MQNVGTPVKAALRYLEGEKEICAVTGCWLGHYRDDAQSKVDGRYKLIGGLVVKGELKALTKHKIYAHTREFFELETQPLGNFQAGILLVRLTNASTGDWLLEKQFIITLDPLSIKPS